MHNMDLSEEDECRRTYNSRYADIVNVYVEGGVSDTADTEAARVSSDIHQPSTVQHTFRNRQDLIPNPLLKVLSPLETEL